MFPLDYFVAAVLWVSNLATPSNPRRHFWKITLLVITDNIFEKQIDKIDTYKMSLILTNDMTINTFKASAETRSLYMCLELGRNKARNMC